MMSALGLDLYSTAALLFLAGSALIAGLARGFSGFGSALIFMPLASTVMSAQIAAPLLLIVDIVTATPLIPRALKQADKRETVLMAAGALFGAPLGAWALTQMDPLTIRWMIVILIVPMLALLMSGWRYVGERTVLLTTAVGGLSGFFGGVAQVGGPPTVLYWLRDGGATIMRANIILFFAMLSVITTFSYLASGILTSSILGLALVAGPVYGLGIWLGSHMFGLASEKTFQRVCYALIAIAAVISLPILDGVLR